MNEHFKSIITKSSGAKEIYEIEMIQSLWSGYGKIIRYGLQDAAHKSVVVKHVRMPNKQDHPRGWNTDLSHERKIKSYAIETAWYKYYSQQCDDTCRIPKCLALDSKDGEVLMVLEDLDDSGYPLRKSSVNWDEMVACIDWLANFHATFLNEKPTHLWDEGTYWHLNTRPEELEELDDLKLKRAAVLIDQKLKESPYNTFVHGDAKLANFCFSKDGKVAAVDFQYVGGGCGMKDLAYFIGSCLYEEDCERLEEDLLEVYFSALRQAIIRKKKEVDADALESNWRELFPIAWTDFHRFLKGWSPGHWKINSYSERLAKEVINNL